MKVLKDAIKADKLEELLVAKWSQFIDSSKLMAYVLQNVQENTNNFAIIPTTNIRSKGMSITISRFTWMEQGFLLWVDFHVPLAISKMAEGTMELHLTHKGNISHIKTLGNIYCD